MYKCAICIILCKKKEIKVWKILNKYNKYRKENINIVHKNEIK